MEAEQNEPTQRPAKWGPPFFTIWTGQAISMLGSSLVQFALIWWLTIETKSATVLALSTLAGFLPQVLLGPFVGTLVDRWNRRLTMLASDSLVALATVGLAVIFAAGNPSVGVIYVFLFIRSVAGVFQYPAMASSTSLMVPKEHLTRVQGLSQALDGGMNIVSAPVAALLVVKMSTQGILMIDVVSALFAIVPLLFIHIPQPQREMGEGGETEEKPSFLQDLAAGFRYVWNWNGVLYLMVVATLLNLILNPAFSLIPLLVTDHFKGGAQQLAWLNMAVGFGFLFGGLFLGVWGGFKRRIMTTLIGMIGLGIGTLLIGLLPGDRYWMAVIAVFAVGFSIPIVNGPVRAIFQTAVAPEMQGRVFSLLRTAGSATTPIGLLLAGPIADWLGIQTWFWFAGGGIILLGVISLFIPALMNLEDEIKGTSGSEEQDAEEQAAPEPAPAASD